VRYSKYLIQNISNEYVSKLKDTEAMRIWQEAETGINNLGYEIWVSGLITESRRLQGQQYSI
jgi:cell fate (sporulation/competence/biofilm development) regulator YmcA (YheA/YmcA/DUF963 family)